MIKNMKQYAVIRYFVWSLCLLLLIGLYIKSKELFIPVAKIHNQEGQTISALNIGGPFDLINQYGKPVKSEDSDGKIRVIYFGYTFCPDLCPMALYNITDALNLLEKDRDKVAVYFITIDPERDTIEKLKEYSENFHKNIQMLSGPKDKLEAVQKAYRVVSQKIQDDKMNDYLMDHSTFIYILNAKGMVVDVMPHTTSGEKIMQSIANQLFYSKEKKS